MANTLKFGNGEWYGKKDTILAYNDENSNYKPLPFDFSRASKATRVNKDGLIEEVGSGQPRIDFQGNTKGALLLEPQRTNSLVQSNQFDTTWINNQSNETESGIGFGGLNYWTINKTAANGYIKQDLSASGTLTLSVYAKKGNLNWIRIIATGGTSTPSTWFDLENGEVGSANFFTEDAKIDFVGNGWYRCSITIDVGTINGVRFYPSQANNDVSGTSGNINIQAAQLEVGSYPTSYIPTSGSAVTRLSELNPFERTDLVSKNLVGGTEMTWFLDSYVFNRSATSVSPKIENITDGNIFIGLNVTNDTSLNIRHKDGTTAANTSSVSFTNGQRVKVAIRIIGTSATAFINGVKVGDFTSSSIDSFDKFSSTNGNPYNINDLKLYNTALTDQELKSLTQV